MRHALLQGEEIFSLCLTTTEFGGGEEAFYDDHKGHFTVL